MSKIDLKNIPSEILYSEVIRRYKCLLRPVGNAIFIGPEDSDKTTQALMLSEVNCWCYISIENIIKENIYNVVDEEKQIDDDGLVEAVYRKIRQPACVRGAVFDGFPRTLAQAVKLDSRMSRENIAFNTVLEFKSSENTLQTANKPFDQDSDESALAKYYASSQRLISIDASRPTDRFWRDLLNIFNKKS
jgi:adenylate kinase